jgi:hypothetical protein
MIVENFKNSDSHEYRAKLQKYFEAVGPVQRSGMAATWAWKVQKERQFRELVVSADITSSQKPIG